MPTALIGITIAFSDNVVFVALGLSAITFIFLSATVSIFKHEILFHSLVSYAKKNKQPKFSPNAEQKGQGLGFTESPLKQFFKKIFLLFKYPYIMYIMSILALFNRLEWILIILGIVSPILWIIYSWKEFKIGTKPFEYLFDPYKQSE